MRPGDPRPIAHALQRARGPVTIIAGEQVARDDARDELERLRAALRARVATVPDAKDVSGSPGLGASSSLGVTGVMGHPGVADAVRNSAVCLLVGTRMPVTSRAGLDARWPRCGRCRSGRPRHLPCTHVHTDDLRGVAIPADTGAHGLRPAAGSARPDPMARAELKPPVYRGAASATATPSPRSMRRCPTGWTSSSTPATPVRRRSTICRCGARPVRRGTRDGRHGLQLRRRHRHGVRRGRRTIVVAGDGSFFMHGLETAHRDPVPAAGHAGVVQQQRPRHVRDPREAVLRRPLQLQPVRAQQSRRRAGRDVPRLARSRRHRHRRAAATLCARRWKPTDRRWSASYSADEIPPFASCRLSRSPSYARDRE